jgi:hypothetical protein
LSHEDLQLVRHLICDRVSVALRRQISYAEILALSPESLADVIREKPKRMFDSSEIAQIMCLKSVRNFFSRHSSYGLVKATHPVLGQIDDFELYFRIVPPGSGGDKKLGHVDWWYDDLYEIPKCERPAYKIWISISTESGSNGLLVKKVAPENFPYQCINTPQGRRPEMVDPPELSFYDFPAISPGQAIIFESENVLHLGSPNNGQFNRVSLEISIKEAPLDESNS